MSNLLRKVYSKPVSFIFVMTVYHVLIIIYNYFFGFHQTKTFVILNSNLSEHKTFTYISNEFLIASVIFTLLIMMLDLLFILILVHEFKLRISNVQIILIECCLFLLAFYYLAVREILFFFSLNTIQIMIAYKIMQKVPVTKYVFITGSLIILVKFALYPIIEILKIAIY